MVIELDENENEPRRTADVVDEVMDRAQQSLKLDPADTPQEMAPGSPENAPEGGEGDSTPPAPADREAVDSSAEETIEGVLVDDDEESRAIIERAAALADPTALVALATEDQMERAVRRIVARTTAIKKFKAAILSLTNVRDWYAHAAEGDEDGIPYLAETGSTKIINAFEIEVEHDGGTREIQPSDIGGYEYVYTGRMRALVFSDTWHPVVGSRWSEDGFFTRGGKRTPDPGDVRKAAHTNFLNRGIKTVCGLKSITWDELEQLPGLENLRKRCVKIGYASGRGDAPPPEPGEMSDLEQGPHIKVKIDREDTDSRNAIKSIKANERLWNKSPGCFYWVVKYSKENISRVMDIHAANSAVKFKLGNVPKEDLPT